MDYKEPEATYVRDHTRAASFKLSSSRWHQQQPRHHWIRRRLSRSWRARKWTSTGPTVINGDLGVSSGAHFEWTLSCGVSPPNRNTS